MAVKDSAFFSYPQQKSRIIFTTARQASDKVLFYLRATTYCCNKPDGFSLALVLVEDDVNNSIDIGDIHLAIAIHIASQVLGPA